jgi:hypothetical protein
MMVWAVTAKGAAQNAIVSRLFMRKCFKDAGDRGVMVGENYQGLKKPNSFFSSRKEKRAMTWG